MQAHLPRFRPCLAPHTPCNAVCTPMTGALDICRVKHARLCKTFAKVGWSDLCCCLVFALVVASAYAYDLRRFFWLCLPASLAYYLFYIMLHATAWAIACAWLACWISPAAAGEGVLHLRNASYAQGPAFALTTGAYTFEGMHSACRASPRISRCFTQLAASRR